MNLKETWTRFRTEHPKVRIRDAAEALGVSEAELVATSCGETATRIEGDWASLVGLLERLGRVMALTRNDAAVHERKGVYENASAGSHVGLVLGEEIDLRLFYNRWKSGFAVEEGARGAMLRSLQFFDAHGTAVHKVYLTEASDLAAFRELVESYRSEDQAPVQHVDGVKPTEEELSDEEIDVSGFRASWLMLQDTHDFFPLLRKFRVTRTQALRLAPTDFARPVPTSSLRKCLETASSTEEPIMVFVSSPGVIQIHTGLVQRVVPADAWINVMDPEFNLHVRQDLIASAWIVRKPTRDGIVTSLEIFDAKGSTIALLFGKRKPGLPESERWRELVAGL
jgi:putative hemin transport protein